MLLSRYLVSSSPSLLVASTRRLLSSSARRREALDVPLWVGGSDLRSGSTFDVHHPKTGEAVSRVSTCSAAELELSIASSWEASRSWRNVPASQRRTILNRVVQLLAERKDELQASYARETSVGPLIKEVDFAYTAGHVAEAAALCTQVKGDIPATNDGSLALVLREPYGPVFSISPFNFGFTLAIRTIVYPLATGNTVLLKASPLIPRTHYLLGKLFKDAGLPDGCLNIIQLDEATVGQDVEAVLADARVRMVNFTGSEHVGRRIGELAGRHCKPALLELGGKAAAIVLETADVDAAAHAILFGSHLHSGQTCMATERAIVVDAVYDAFVGALRAKNAALVEAVPGGMELSAANGVRQVRELVADALEKGAKPLSAVDPGASSASSVQPLVLEDVDPSMALFAEESFGPVLAVLRARDAAHAVELANGSRYGLSASVWSADVQAALAVARALESGAVHVNSSTVHDEAGLPHGGHKASGFGRFNGAYALEAFTQTKTITLRTGEGLPPFHLLA